MKHIQRNAIAYSVRKYRLYLYFYAIYHSQRIFHWTYTSCVMRLLHKNEEEIIVQ